VEDCNIFDHFSLENVQITDKILYFTTLLLGSGVIDNSLKLYSLEDNVFQGRWRLDQIVL
jgi:hypothetical protein